MLAILALQAYTFGMNRTSTEKRAAIISCLVEGNSIRATVRMTGASKNTVVKLLVDLGRACTEYQDKVFRNLKCKRIQCDEIWSFVYAKDKNLPEDLQGKTALAACGHGRRWIRKRNSFRAGLLAAVTPAPLTTSCTTWPGGCRIASS